MDLPICDRYLKLLYDQVRVQLASFNFELQDADFNTLSHLGFDFDRKHKKTKVDNKQLFWQPWIDIQRGKLEYFTLLYVPKEFH